jgi:hypothetical protein
VSLDVIVVAFDAIALGSLGELVAFHVLIVAFDAIALGSLGELVTLDIVITFDAISLGSLGELVALDVVVLCALELDALIAHRLPDAAATWLILAHLYLRFVSNYLAVAKSDCRRACCLIKARIGQP